MNKMTTYTCPECGGDVCYTLICTVVPIYIWVCRNCGWRPKEKDCAERCSFDPVKAKLDEDWTLYEALDNVMVNG